MAPCAANGIKKPVPVLGLYVDPDNYPGVDQLKDSGVVTFRT